MQIGHARIDTLLDCCRDLVGAIGNVPVLLFGDQLVDRRFDDQLFHRALGRHYGLKRVVSVGSEGHGAGAEHHDAVAATHPGMAKCVEPPQATGSTSAPPLNIATRIASPQKVGPKHSSV